MTRSLNLRALMLFAPLVALAGIGEAQAEWKPTRPVGFNVAGGRGRCTDQFARVVQSVVQKHQLAPDSIIVSNKGGGAGSEAFVYGEAAGNGAHKVVFATNDEWLMPVV